MAQRALVPLAEGFEEIEAVTIVDVLRRAGVEVVLAALSGSPVRGAHGIGIEADADLEEAQRGRFDLLVLPGGQPGTRHLGQDPRVLALVRDFATRNKTVAAICAAPWVLAQAGVLEGASVTSHPSVRAQLAPARVDAAARVLRRGAFLSSPGPGTALEFALALVADCAGQELADELARAMIVRA